MKERVEVADHCGIEVDAGEVRVERVEVVAAGGIDRVGVGDARVGAAVRRERPAAVGHVAGAVRGTGHAVPEPAEVRAGTGEPAGDGDDGDPLSHSFFVYGVWYFEEEEPQINAENADKKKAEFNSV